MHIILKFECTNNVVKDKQINEKESKANTKYITRVDYWVLTFPEL